MNEEKPTYDERKCIIRDGLVVPVPDDEENYHGTMMNARYSPHRDIVLVSYKSEASTGKVWRKAGRTSKIDVFPRVYY